MGAPVVATDEDDDNLSYALEPVVAEFEVDSASGQIKVKTATNFNHEVKGSYTVTVKATDSGSPPASSTKEVVISITDANDTPVFDGGASVSRSLNENQGKLSTDVDTVVGAPVVVNDADKPDETISFVLDPVSTEFKIDASGQIKVKTATNFNHEKTAAYTVTVKATDDGTPAASANQEVVINIANQPERPNDYSGHGLVTMGMTGSQITLSWNNTDYEAQFDAEDRYSIVISYGTGGSGVGTLTLAADATAATLAGLEPGTSYDITLQWLSRDEVGSDNPATISGATTAAGIEIDRAGLSSLTPTSKTSAISLRLKVPPASANVTLTITSVNPEHVEVDKQTMVFSPSNWNTGQALMFSLTDAGVGVEGMRSVAVSITVHDQSNSDATYRDVAGQEVAVEVDVPYAGKALYDSSCMGCHGDNGQGGLGSVFNPIPGDSVISGAPAKAIEVVLLGRDGTSMRSYATSTNAEIASILSYIYGAWNDGEPVTEAQVKQVRDMNAFDADSLAASRAEGDAAEGDVLATVELSANKVGGALINPAFSIQPGADGDGFGIGASSGEITVSSARQFDYESGKDKYTLNIRASSGGVDVDRKFVLTITPVDEPPVFASDTFPAQQVSGTSGGMFTFHAATDPEDPEGSVTYSASLVDDTPLPTGVSFDQGTRVFTVASGTSAITLTLKVVAEDSTGETAEQEFELRIVEDGIDADSSALEVTGSSRTDTVAVKLLSQPAGSQNVTVTMVSGNPADLAVLPAHLVFTPANWETTQDLTVSLTDAGLEVKGSRSIDVNLAVHGAGNSASNYQGVSAVSVPVAVNVANAAPEFAAGERSKTHEENNGAVGTNVGTPVAATDEDNDDAVDLMYSVNPASSRFGIDAGTGQLTVKTATDFNHEVKDAYTVTVEVHDNEAAAIRGKATVTVAIGITDVNEAPEFDSGVIIRPLAENDGTTETTSTGTSVGAPVVATDEDGDNLSYALEPVVAEFEVDSASGQIKVKTATNFNHEVKGSYTVTLKATDDATSPASSTKEVVISITDANDAPEFDSGAIIRSLAENDGTTETTSTGTSVGAPVVATDEDDDNLSYALEPVVAEFEVDSASGQIKVKTATNFNHEVKGSYTVTLKATDDATSPASSTKEVVISITDANDTPVFDGGASVSRSLNENQGKLSTDVDTVVGAPVVVNDADKPDETISFVLDPVSTEFKIDASGQIKVKTATNFNHEKTAAYTVTVKATDDGTPAASAEQEVVINIANQPERPNDYSGHGLALGVTGSQITLSWNNTDYEAQFDAEDRYSIVISYGTGGSGVGTLTLAADATAATLAGLNSGTSYAITLQWLSRDELGSNTPATVAGTTTAPGVEIDRAGLSALTPTSKTSAISLRLKVPPASANVTLTITSVNPEHVEVDKQTMVFSTSNWNTWQALMFSLTDAGIEIEGMRSVAVSITVHDQSNSDATYRDVAGQEVAVEVDVPYAGKALYDPSCMGCHGDNGQGGLGSVFNPIPGDSVISGNPAKAIEAVLLGRDGTLMNSYAGSSDADIASMLSYIYGAWNDGVPVTEAQVKQVRDMNAFDADSLAASRAEGDAAEGDVLATVELSDNEVGEALRNPAFSIQPGADGDGFGIGASSGVITVSTARQFDYESGKDKYTLNIRASDGGVDVDREFVLTITPVDEPPVFASDTFPAQQVSGTSGGMFTFHAATDPEDTEGSVTYSASLVDDTPLPTGGVSFDEGTRVFTVASGTSAITLTLKVVAEDSTGETAEQEFELRIVEDGIDADSSALEVTGSSRTDTVAVKLLSQPAGGQNVTVTMVSSTPADLAALPAHLVFTPANWETAQDLTVSLTDAAIKRDGNIEVNLMVHDAANSATNYRSVPAVPVAVAVDIPNIAPVFAAAQRSRSRDEPVGVETTAIGSDIGTPIVATDADNDDAADLRYSINPASARFGIAEMTGQLTLKLATKFNHEGTPSYTVTVEVQDGEHASVRGNATVTVSINITDVDEAPASYTSANLTVSGAERTRITVSWNNNEYEAQFEEPDRASIVVSYGSGSSVRSTMTAAIDDTEVTLTGLSASTAYTMTIRWYSADGLFGDSTNTLSHTTPANQVPVFVATSLLTIVAENSGSVGMTVGTVAAEDGDSDPIAYSIVTGADAAGFGIGSDSGDITISTAQTFDYESKDKYTINVRASDGAGGVGNGVFVLSITNIDEPPAFPSGQQPSRVALVGVPRTLTLVAASDPEDAEGAVTYSLPGKPSWITRTGRELVVNANSAARGLAHDYAGGNRYRVEY